jgi:hypothetical protein
MSRTEVSERFDPARFDAASETYIVPSYDGGKARIAVDPTGAIPAPPDWDGVARRLRDPNPLVRSYAFYNIHGLVEAGDEQAVRIAIWGIRADDEDPRAQIFASLRILASRNPKRFRELLRALRDAYQSMLRGRFKRTETTVLITVSEAAALHILGALERVALTIPEGGTVANAWEAEARGLARTTALVSALAEARTELYRYLTSSEVWVRARALAGDLVEQIQKVTDSLLEYPAIALVILVRDQDGSEFMYALQMDLVENYRWIVATREKVEEIDLMLEMYRGIYGDQISFMEEGKALLESRFQYLQYVSDNPLPTMERIRSLRQAADQFYSDWFGRAADVKSVRWRGMLEQLQDAFRKLPAIDWFPDSYSHLNQFSQKYDERYRMVLEQLWEVDDLLQKAETAGKGVRGPDYLTRVSNVERQLPLLAVRVELLQLWNAIHSLTYVVIDKNLAEGGRDIIIPPLFLSPIL